MDILRKLSLVLTAIMLSASVFAQTTETETVFDLPGPHGKLNCAISLPETDSYPMVMILHGLTGCKDETEEINLAKAFQDAGMGTIRFDFMGHGKSEGNFTEMTIPKEMDETMAVYEYVRAIPQVTKIAICGHSQGGLIAALFAGQMGSGKIAAALLFAPAANLKYDAIMGSHFGQKYDPHNPPEKIKTLRDMDMGREYLVTAQSLPVYETAALYDGPAAIFHGTADDMVPMIYGVAFHLIWKDSELHLMDGDHHGFQRHAPECRALATSFLQRVFHLIPED